MGVYAKGVGVMVEGSGIGWGFDKMGTGMLWDGKAKVVSEKLGIGEGERYVVGWYRTAQHSTDPSAIQPLMCLYPALSRQNNTVKIVCWQ